MKCAFLHLYAKSHKSHAEVVSFGRGLVRHGWCVEAGEPPGVEAHYDLIVQWGARVEPMAVSDEICTLETSYIEPRSKYCSVGFGHGINNRLRHYGPFEDASRWNERFSDCVKPWRDKSDGNTLIMGQCPGDMALKGHEPFFHWVLATFRALKEEGIDPIYRAHPNMSAAGLIARRDRMRKEWKMCVHRDEEHIWAPWLIALDEGLTVMADGIPLAEALAETRSVVTFNSNSGVDAVLSGVPAVTMDRGAMAWDVTGHMPAEIVRPDRTAWAHALAWKQWTKDELESGAAWDIVCPPHLG